MTKIKAESGRRGPGIHPLFARTGISAAPERRKDTALLAAIQYEAGFPIDEFMAAAAATLRSEGMRVGGAVQLNAGGTACSAMTLQDLATGERFGISQQLGSQASGCRLDPRGLAGATARLDASVTDALDLLVVNKFGKAEADGGGLRSVLARAMDCGIPVLTAVRSPYAEAWLAFHGGLATDLVPSRAAALDERRHAVARSRASAHALGSQIAR